MLCSALAALGTLTIPTLASADTGMTPVSGTPQNAGAYRAQRGFAALNLSDDQRQQIKALRRQAREQMMGLLTADQRAQVQSETAGGQNRNPMSALRNLNLSDDQRAHLRAIGKNTRKQILALLTPQQRQQFRAMHRHRQQGFGQQPQGFGQQPPGTRQPGNGNAQPGENQ